MAHFIRGCLIAAGYVLVFLGSARAVTIGDTSVESASDNANGNLLLAQSATLAQTATIQSLSFYVTAASGNLILGIYDATGPNGGPGTLQASTGSFTPTTGWNTTNVATPVSLTAGTYWLAYLPSSNDLSFVKTNGSGNCAVSDSFGGMPSKFSTSPASCTPTTWSFYATLAVATTTGSSPPPSGSTPGSTPFVALHTYYMSPTGSDRNNGMSAATPWATPNHSVVCGDVIIAAAGTYSAGQFGDTFGIVRNCPSTTGGIDGTGGIYFAVMLCGGSDLMACNISGDAAGGGDPNTLVEFNHGDGSGSYDSFPVANNWAVEGFNLNNSPQSRGFGVRTCTATNGLIHHFAVINNVISNDMQAYGDNDCGSNSGSSAEGVDYRAAIGNIAQNANNNGTYQGGICVAAFDFGALGKYDTAPGTHAYAYNNYAMANQVPACDQYDGEAFMTDTPNAHLFQGTVVYANNIAYDSTRACIQLTGGGYQPVTFKLYNNTCYSNNMQPGSTGANGSLGEFNLSSDGGSHPWSISFWNNIVLTPAATESGVPLFDEIVGGATWGSWKEGTAVGTGLQNVLWDQQTTCMGDCAPTTSPYISSYYNNNPVASNSQNISANPNFTNTSDLMTNRIGVPNCNRFTNTTACLGWNANTRSLTTPSVISDLVPTASGTSGKGYQLPSTSCAPNADYPAWLKGVVYLHWNGSSLTENSDLVTKPCNM